MTDTCPGVLWAHRDGSIGGCSLDDDPESQCAGRHLVHDGNHGEPIDCFHINPDGCEICAPYETHN